MLRWLVSLLVDLMNRLGIPDMPTVLFDPGSRVYWLCLVTAIGLAALVYVFGDQRSLGPYKGNLLGYLVPWRILTHPSAILDYKIWALNWMGRTLFSPLSVGMTTVLAWLAVQPEDAAPTAMSTPLFLAYLAVFALVWDFTFYVTHALRHKLPFLWAFHSVHHSARVLTPVTLYRGHLFEILWVGSALGLTTGLATAAFLAAVPHAVPVSQLLQANLVFYVFNLLGANLRHSHVWLSYGPYLSYVFISPAQHQIHHSRAERHFDKNHGSMLAIWDWMFGTLYIPQEYEAIDYGVDPETDARHETLLATVVEPLKDAAKALGVHPGRSPNNEPAPRP